MKIGLVCSGRLPVLKYGGTQRIVYWLGQELVRRGHEVTLVAGPGSSLPGAATVAAQNAAEAASALPPSLDIIHFHGFYPKTLDRPHLKTTHGNADRAAFRDGNWSFVSRDHAERHGRGTYVYNGVALDEYAFSPTASERYLFLARVNLAAKNLTGAMRLAKRFDVELDIGGGSRFDLLLRSRVRREGAFFTSLAPRFHFHGMVGGEDKKRLLSGARGLLLPVRGPEAFGLVAVEALASGTPVIATRHCAMPEIIAPDVGFLCTSDEEFGEAFANIGSISRARCREYAAERFSVQRMTDGYLALYRRILDGEAIP